MSAVDTNSSNKENKTRVTMRGKASLLLNTSSSDSETETTTRNEKTSGIYASIIKTTKQELKTTKNKFALVESKNHNSSQHHFDKRNSFFSCYF